MSVLNVADLQVCEFEKRQSDDQIGHGQLVTFEIKQVD